MKTDTQNNNPIKSGTYFDANTFAAMSHFFSERTALRKIRRIAHFRKDQKPEPSAMACLLLAEIRISRTPNDRP